MSSARFAKTREYFGLDDNPRPDVVASIRQRDLKVFEVGCGNGSLGAELKRRGIAATVTGVELDETAARAAGDRIDEVLVGDAGKLNLDRFRDQFDLLIFADVLEHLRDPWGLLKHCASVLKPGGRVLVSVPNIRNWRVLRSLVFRGDWRYVESGILDNTHIRFFTSKTLRRMIEAAGFTSVEILPGFTAHPAAVKARWANRVSLGLFSGFLAHQYLGFGVKSS